MYCLRPCLQLTQYLKVALSRPTGKDIFELPFVFVETMLLLFSSITFGFGMIAMKRKDVAGLKRWLKVTFLLGLGFICMEVYEFHHLIEEGYGRKKVRSCLRSLLWWALTVCT